MPAGHILAGRTSAGPISAGRAAAPSILRPVRWEVAIRSVLASRHRASAERATGSPRPMGGAAARMGDPGRRVFGNRAIANVALQSQFPQARFQGGFSGSAWPSWLGGFVLGWFGPVFWPYAYYDLFDYVYWPYAYDDFWPYAYDDVYYGIYGPYAYYDSGVNGRGVSYGRYG